MFGLVLAVQLASATWWVDSFNSPNFSVDIARRLAVSGAMSCDPWWRLKGPYALERPALPLMYFHLPGHPMFLAAGFRLLPKEMEKCIHVAVPAFLVTALLSCFSGLVGRGPLLTAGLVGAFLPFVVLHGPVWDDTFLGAAIDWTLLAGLVQWLRRRTAGAPATTWAGTAAAILALFVVGAFDSLVRSQSVPIFVGLGLWIVLVPSLRRCWPAAAAILAGQAVGLAAWGLRNLFVVGVFTVGSSHDGITLWESNYPDAERALLAKGQVERLNDETMQDDFAATADLSEHEADRHFARKAAAYIIAHPAEVLRVGLVKTAVSLLGVRPEAPLAGSRNLVALATNGALLLLALIGLVAMGWRAVATRVRPSPPALLLIGAFGAMASVTGLLFVIGPAGLRYRIGLDPFLWVAAAVGAWSLAGVLAVKTSPSGRVPTVTAG